MSFSWRSAFVWGLAEESCCEYSGCFGFCRLLLERFRRLVVSLLPWAAKPRKRDAKGHQKNAAANSELERRLTRLESLTTSDREG